MWLDILFVFLGLMLLVGGGEVLVRGASGIALLARVTPAVVGLTVVAAGTSMPELVVSIHAALQGSPGLAVGNVVGSNIFNIGAILGVSALMAPLVIQGNSIKLEWPVMILASLQFVLLARDGTIDSLEGGFLLAAVIAFVAYAVWIGRRESTGAGESADEPMATASFGRTGGAALGMNIGAILLGAGLLAGGSTVLVSGAVSIASSMGVSDALIGLTIVAAGTGTPELVASLVAVRRGRADMAVGNIIGSSIFNLLGILGATALVHPLAVAPEIIARDAWWMLGFALVLFPLMRSQMKITRVEGAILFLGYIAYMGVLIYGQQTS